MKHPLKIMVFGRPGSGKSTFAKKLHDKFNIPLYHLDKYFFKDNWVEEDYEKFTSIQKDFVSRENWIIDGNCVQSLELRYSNADLVLFFSYPKLLCLIRLFKRLYNKNSAIDDRAKNCKESVTLKLIRYMWNFNKRVDNQVKEFRKRYPDVKFVKVKSDKDLKSIELEILNTYS